LQSDSFLFTGCSKSPKWTFYITERVEKGLVLTRGCRQSTEKFFQYFVKVVHLKRMDMKVLTMPKKPNPSEVLESGVLLKQTPTWWVAVYAYLLAGAFCYFSHLFFNWFPPYLYEIFKNLRGLPTSWADLGLFWAHRGLNVIAIVTALYYQFWQIGTRYILTEQEIRIEYWFPMRKVNLIPLGAIRRYGYQQNWLAVLLNFGTIDVDTAGPTPALLPFCPQPKIFINALKPKVEAKLQVVPS